MNYYMAEGDQQRGPFPVEQLAAQGLRPDTLVWHEGMRDWQRADSVLELRGMFVGAVGVPPVLPPARYGAYSGQTGAMLYDKSAVNSKRVLAGIMGIIFGALGVHKFILGFVGTGILQILITFATCGVGHFIGLIEGIIYLSKTDEEFYRTYIVERRNWF